MNPFWMLWSSIIMLDIKWLQKDEVKMRTTQSQSVYLWDERKRILKDAFFSSLASIQCKSKAHWIDAFSMCFSFTLKWFCVHLMIFILFDADALMNECFNESSLRNATFGCLIYFNIKFHHFKLLTKMLIKTNN